MAGIGYSSKTKDPTIKTMVVRFRCTDKEAEIIENLARRNGISTSEMIRKLIQKAAGVQS